MKTNKPTALLYPPHLQHPEIKYIHLRYAYNPSEYIDDYDPYGGATLAYKFITNRETDTVNLEFGLSLCSSQDVYCRSAGRRIAIHRLLSKAPNWYYLKELSSEDAVLVGYEELILLAAEKWKKELQTWATIKDNDNSDNENEFKAIDKYLKETKFNNHTHLNP